MKTPKLTHVLMGVDPEAAIRPTPPGPEFWTAWESRVRRQRRAARRARAWYIADCVTTALLWGLVAVGLGVVAWYAAGIVGAL